MKPPPLSSRRSRRGSAIAMIAGLIASLPTLPTGALADATCTAHETWSRGMQLFDNPCGCDTQQYPTLQNAVEPFGASIRPTASAGINVNDQYLWSCGARLEWRQRPDTLSACFELAAKVREAVEAARLSLPESSRPALVGGRDLACNGYIEDREGADQRQTKEDIERNTAITKAVQVLSDPGRSEREWAAAWIDLSLRDNPARFFQGDIITTHLQAATPAERRLALFLTGRFGTAAREAAPDVMPLLNDADATVRAAALRTLGQISEGDRSVVFVLKRRLTDPDPAIAAAAAEGLSSVGRAAVGGVPELINVLDDSTRPIRVREAARDALRAIGGDEAILAVQRYESGAAPQPAATPPGPGTP